MHRTTIRLDDHLLVEAKAYAVQRRVSLTAVIEEALRTHLARAVAPAERAKKRRIRFPTFAGGGYQAGIKTWDDVKRVLAQDEIDNLRRIEREDAAR